MKEHRLEKRIYYHDTDCGGVVYYANYLKYLEEGRTEFMRGAGVDTSECGRDGVFFAVVHMEADYKAPAHYGDTIEILTLVEKVGNASIHFRQRAMKAGMLLLDAKVVLACIDRDIKARPVPANMKEKLENN